MTTRILITGSRTWTDNTRIRNALAHWCEQYPDAVLVHGNARGADRIAAVIWRRWGLPTEAHPANWSQHGRAAGHLRNREMVQLGATVCIAFIRNHSPGASGCVALAHQAGIPVHLHTERTTQS